MEGMILLKVKLTKEDFYYNIFNTLSTDIDRIENIMNKQFYAKAVIKDLNVAVTERLQVFKRLEKL